MRPIRVLIVDDQELVRSGFALILNGREDLDVVGEGVDGAAAIELARELRPDVVLMDIRMPNVDGIEATAAIVAAQDQVRVLMLTTFDDEDLVLKAMRAGASGFVLKDIRPADLVDGIRSVHGGDAVLSPVVTRGLVDRALAHRGPIRRSPTIDALSEREQQVLRLIARGAANSEVAGRLVISETTVKTHVASILRKLGVRDRVQAVVAAYDAGLVQPLDP